MMRVKLLKKWRERKAGDELEIGDVWAASLIRRGIGRALGKSKSAPPEDKALKGPEVQK